MGREIRRVPRDWEHPKDKDGHYIPMFDKEYDEAARKWMDELVAWEEKGRSRAEGMYYWEWGPPRRDTYRKRSWTEEEASCYQVYETVTEGTPVSPVFESRGEMKEWLIAQGYQDGAAQRFVDLGWAPSLVFNADTGSVRMDIHSLDMENSG